MPCLKFLDKENETVETGKANGTEGVVSFMGTKLEFWRRKSKAPTHASVGIGSPYSHWIETK